MISLRLYTVVLGTIGLAFAGFALLRRKPRNAEDVEHERRIWLNSVGRITDGTVIDVQEIVTAVNRSATMLIYQYDVAGVSYEASQDVTYLRDQDRARGNLVETLSHELRTPLTSIRGSLGLLSCRLGLPTSVKYDARNPGNSMVIAEGWMGLRQ